MGKSFDTWQTKGLFDCAPKVNCLIIKRLMAQIPAPPGSWGGEFITLFFTSQVQDMRFLGGHACQCDCFDRCETKCNQPSLYSSNKVPIHSSPTVHGCRSLARSSSSRHPQEETQYSPRWHEVWDISHKKEALIDTYEAVYIWGIGAQTGNSTSSKSTSSKKYGYNLHQLLLWSLGNGNDLEKSKTTFLQNSTYPEVPCLGKGLNVLLLLHPLQP